MNQITIVEIQGQLVVDSRDIAKQLENEHESLMALLKKHQVKIEKGCKEVIRLEIGKPPKGSQGGRPIQFAWLTEKQSAALLNLSRNTDRAVDLKIGLAVAFVDQKHQVENPLDRKLFTELADRIAKLESQPVPALPSVVPEMTRAAQVKELVINFHHRTGADYDKTYQMIYTKFGLLYTWKPNSKSKLSKIAQIEAAGLIEELYQLALKLFI